MEGGHRLSIRTSGLAGVLAGIHGSAGAAASWGEMCVERLAAGGCLVGRVALGAMWPRMRDVAITASPPYWELDKAEAAGPPFWPDALYIYSGEGELAEDDRRYFLLGANMLGAKTPNRFGVRQRCASLPRCHRNFWVDAKATSQALATDQTVEFHSFQGCVWPREGSGRSRREAQTTLELPSGVSGTLLGGTDWGHRHPCGKRHPSMRNGMLD